MDTKVSIYKKTEENYLLKLKASRAFYSEVSWLPVLKGYPICPSWIGRRTRNQRVSRFESFPNPNVQIMPNDENLRLEGLC